MKNWKFAWTFFGVFKSVCLCTYHVCCYFLHGKITDIYTCMQSVYVVVVFMNTPNLLFTLNMFLWSLFTYFYKIIHIYFHQFVNNLYYMLSIFVKMQIIYSFDSNKSKLNSLIMCCKNKTAGHYKILWYFLVRNQMGLSDYRTSLFVNLILSNLVQL